MIALQTQQLDSELWMSIVEVNDPKIVECFENRFQLTVVRHGKNILPKNKEKFLNIETNHYLYPLFHEKTNTFITVDVCTYYEKKICDRSLEECTHELLKYVKMYDKGKNVEVALKKKYRI